MKLQDKKTRRNAKAEAREKAKSRELRNKISFYSLLIVLPILLLIILVIPNQ